MNKHATRWAWLGWVPALCILGCGFADRDGSENAHFNDSGVGPEDAVLTISQADTRQVEVGQEVELIARVTGSRYGVSFYEWTVVDPEGHPVDVHQQGDRAERAVFSAEMEGDYGVSCQATLDSTGAVVSAYVKVRVVDPDVENLMYKVRLVPPAGSTFALSQEMVEVGRAHRTGLNWILKETPQVEVEVKDDGLRGDETLVPSRLRVFRGSQDPLPTDLVLGQGSGTLATPDLFHLLVLPLSSSGAQPVAPFLLENQTPEDFVQGSDGPVPVRPASPAAAVQGSVSVAGIPLADARVSLRLTSPNTPIGVPSTSSTTGEDGSFSLSARLQGMPQGDFSVVPDSLSGFPVARVEGIQTPGSGAIWDFAYELPATVEMSGTVSAPDGEAPAAEAYVMLSWLGAVAGSTTVGELILRDSQGTLLETHEAQGLFQIPLHTDQQGQLTDPETGAAQVRVPQGVYSVQGWPGAGAPADHGVFQQEVTIESANGTADPLALRLKQRTLVKGRVVDPEGRPVRAKVWVEADAVARHTLSDAQGQFSFSVDADLDHSLIIDPLWESGRSLGRFTQKNLSVHGAVVQLPDQEVPRAQDITGTVHTQGGLVVPGVLLRIWCDDARCPHQGMVDETTTAADGTFVLRVPASPKKAQ